MLTNQLLWFGKEILFTAFVVYLFYCYFGIFFEHKNIKISVLSGYIIFILWQLIISYVNSLPGYVNISINIICTLLASTMIYKGKFWNKCVFTIAFNAIWMLIEILCGYLLIIYCEQYSQIQSLGSFFSKMIFMFIILAMKKIITNEGLKELPTKYSIMLVLIPIDSIFIMNDIFILSYRSGNAKTDYQSAIAAAMLLGLNVLVFYIYLKLADELQLKRINSVYEKQLELCERHQQETELSTLLLRDTRHNMKNDMISILAYAEKKDFKKIIHFVSEVMQESGINSTSITNSGNIVIDSLIGYWYDVSKKTEINFSANLSIPIQMSFKGADLCLILGNILENAVEAATKVASNKYINIQMKYDKGNLLISVRNSYNGLLIKTKEKRLKSTKGDCGSHGIGLPSVYRIANKYHGIVAIDDSVPEHFLIRVVLYG